MRIEELHQAMCSEAGSWYLESDLGERVERELRNKRPDKSVFPIKNKVYKLYNTTPAEYIGFSNEDSAYVFYYIGRGVGMLTEKALELALNSDYAGMQTAQDTGRAMTIRCSTCGNPIPQTAVLAEKAWCSDECYKNRSKRSEPGKDIHDLLEIAVDTGLKPGVIYAKTPEEKST